VTPQLAPPRRATPSRRRLAPFSRRLWTWLRPLVGIAILATLVWRLGTGAFVAGLRVVDVWSVLAALGIGLLVTVCGAWRWCLVARRVGLALTLRQAILLNSVLPAGVLGDVHRAVNHGQQSGDVGRGVRAVVMERAAGQAVLIVTGVAVLLTQPGIMSALVGSVLPGRWSVVVLLCVLAALAMLAAWARWGPSAPAWRRALRTAMADARTGLLSRDTWPGVLALSIAALAGHVCMFIVAARVADSSVPLTRLLPLFVLALLVMGLPINVGGWGPREAFLALAFGAVGLGARQGVAIAVAYGVLTLIACLPGTAVLFVRRRHRPEPGSEQIVATDS
jgi:uncharacterized membrane protein YbhN (UPF0104 family)